MPTVRQLARQLASLKEELQDIEVVTLAENGELYSPNIKFILKDKFNLDLTKENVDKVYLTWR